MYRYTVWMNIEGVSVGFPLVTWVHLDSAQRTAVGEAIAQGAGQQFLYVEEAES